MRTIRLSGSPHGVMQAFDIVRTIRMFVSTRAIYWVAVSGPVWLVLIRCCV